MTREPARDALSSGELPIKKILLFWMLLLLASLACRLSATPMVEPVETPLAPDYVFPTPAPASACSILRVDTVTTLVESGGNVDWSPDGNWIIYDAPNAENWTQT